MPPVSDPTQAIADDAALRELALNLRWSWNHASDVVWRQLDAEQWQLTQNPWGILQTVSPERIRALLAEPAFAQTVQSLLAEQRRAERAPAWFQRAHPAGALREVAYFSMEFMLSEALPIYSGGLGNVAGDQLKTASDLGVPVIGVGLLYAQGYFRQAIGPDGGQQALYPVNEPGQLPVRKLLAPSGEWLRLRIELPGRPVWIRTWEVQVGRTRLYLLDTNDPANLPAHRCITSELYGGGSEQRLQQEMVLGIGGWKLLRALGLNPQVCHLNEGHAALAALERARCFKVENASSFAEAMAATRAGNIFTTHTAVAAGFDRFAPDLMQRLLHAYAEHQLGITMDDLMALGRQDRTDQAEPFTMAYLAVRASGAVTAVSALHEQVSRRIFQPLFPRWPEAEVPIGHVTNGIHVPTWDCAAADALWTQAAGKDRWLGDLTGVEDSIRHVNDVDIWRMRAASRTSLVTEIRRQHEQQRAEPREPDWAGEFAQGLFDPDVLTLGFARRFATYKRPNLLLHDPERLVRILNNNNRGAQLILAGKAHPQDFAGQAMIRQWTAFARRPEVRARIMFLPDYDMLQSQCLVQGVDVWINTPLRPWEASGTSGMKILANGGLNLSERDGWWAEAYAPDVGWAIGDGSEHGQDAAIDSGEADALYALLEQQIVPEFYYRGEDGIPTRWVARIRESMARLTPRFSANRAVRDYTEMFYLPAAQGYADRSAQGGLLARDLASWHERLSRHWSQLGFGCLQVADSEQSTTFSVEVRLGDLPAELIDVELYAAPDDGEPPFRKSMTMQDGPLGPDGMVRYVSTIPHRRPAGDYTPRLIPRHGLADVPLDANNILWQR
jgi:starch phosphorylase